MIGIPVYGKVYNINVFANGFYTFVLNCGTVILIFSNLILMVLDKPKEKEENWTYITCKPVGKMRSITKKLENKLAEEAKLQKENKEGKKDKASK